MGSIGVTATVSTPVSIQNMTSSYVTITSHVLTAFSLWEQAEALTRKNKGKGWAGSEGVLSEGGGYTLSHEARATESSPLLLHNLVAGLPGYDVS